MFATRQGYFLFAACALGVECLGREPLLIPGEIFGAIQERASAVSGYPPPNTVTDENEEQYDRDRTCARTTTDWARFLGKRISVLTESAELCLRLGRQVSLPIIPIEDSVAAFLPVSSSFESVRYCSAGTMFRMGVEGYGSMRRERQRDFPLKKPSPNPNLPSRRCPDHHSGVMGFSS